MNKTSLLCVALLGAIVPTQAATVLYWDTNSFLPGASDAGFAPDGFWDEFTTTWNSDPTGGEAGIITSWMSIEDTAVFSAGAPAGLYNVSISGTQTAAAILIEEGTVAFSGGAAAVGTGTITINSGATLSIDSVLRLSGQAGSKMVLNGGTIMQTNPGNAGSFIPPTMELQVGPNGGAVNYTSSGGGTVSIYTGTITGSGTLTKRGPHEFRYQSFGLPNSTYGKLVVEEGLFRLGSANSIADERGFGAVPAVFTPDAITLSGGGSIGTSFSTTLHPNRGITLGPGGGAINGGAAPMTIPGAITGNGGLTLMNNVTLTGDNTYTGGTVIDGGSFGPGTGTAGGTVNINSPTGLGATTNSLTVNNIRTGVAQNVVLNLSNTAPTITGSLSGFIAEPASGTNTITINNRGQAFTVNQTVAGVFPGVIAGTGSFTLGDLSTAALTLAGANTYSGGTTIEAGTLTVFGSASKLGTGNVTVEQGAVKLTIQTGVLDAINDSATLSLAGGGSSNVADFGFVELGAGINETIFSLVLGGVSQPNGTYGSSLSNATIKNDEYFSGLGVLTVVPEPGTATALLGGLSMLLGAQRFRRRG